MDGEMRRAREVNRDSEDRFLPCQDNCAQDEDFARGGDSNLATFNQLQGQAASFEVGAPGDPGFGVINFVAEKSGVPNQAR